jgi:hypothetical protein
MPGPASVEVLAAGVVLIIIGQALNGLVFYRLGRVGTFYGDRLGHDVVWCEAFPFSALTHPQYVGTVMSIWGFFLVTRFPHDDWYLLPFSRASTTPRAPISRRATRPPGGRGQCPSRHRMAWRRPFVTISGRFLMIQPSRAAATMKPWPRPAFARSG